MRSISHPERKLVPQIGLRGEKYFRLPWLGMLLVAQIQGDRPDSVVRHAPKIGEARSIRKERGWRKVRALDQPLRLAHPVWTENSTLAFRRPIPGGVESAEPVNTSLVGPGQALESTMRPVHFESVRKIGRAGLLSVCLSLGTGWLTRTAVTIRGALVKT